MDETRIFDFIERVHSEEILWNITINDFKNVEKKNQIWNKIGLEFNLTGELRKSSK